MAKRAMMKEVIVSKLTYKIQNMYTTVSHAIYDIDYLTIRMSRSPVPLTYEF